MAGIDDVARRAGVSTATVSRALRGLPEVRESTRARVLQAAADLHYTPSSSAASLASGRSRTIGLLTASFVRWFNRNVVAGAERHLRSEGYDVLLHAFDHEPDGSRTPIDMSRLQRRVDGVLVLGIPLTPLELEALDRLEVPVVFVGTAPPGRVRVSMDDAAGARMAIEHLVSLGHRRIGQVTTMLPHDSAWQSPPERETAAQEALARAGLDTDPALRAFGDYTQDSGRRAAAELLDRVPDLTAIFAHSDEMAFGVLEELRARGIGVPDQISVMGIDGHELDDLIGLSTIQQDATTQGETGAMLLLNLIHGEAVDPEARFAIRCVKRHSTGPVMQSTIMSHAP